MKQNIIYAVMAMLLSLSGHSAAAANSVDWGMKIALDAELPGKWKGEYASFTMFRPGVGVTLGAVCNVGFGRNFYFEPGVSLFYSGYKYKDLIIQGADANVTESDPKVSKYGLQVPLLVGYSFDISDRFGIDVFTGPQLRYAFAGNIGIKNKIIKEELGDSFDLFNIQRRVDCSWKIGVGFPLKNGCVISLEGDIGMTNLLKHDMTFRENRIAIGFVKYL